MPGLLVFHIAYGRKQALVESLDQTWWAEAISRGGVW